MAVEIMVMPRVIVGVALDTSDPMVVLNDPELHRSVKLQAIEAVENMEPETLKKLVVSGLVDAGAYPHDFAEVI